MQAFKGAAHCRRRSTPTLVEVALQVPRLAGEDEEECIQNRTRATCDS